MGMMYGVIGLCGIALAISLGNIFLNAGKRWENGERWEIPPHGRMHKRS